MGQETLCLGKQTTTALAAARGSGATITNSSPINTRTNVGKALSPRESRAGGHIKSPGRCSQNPKSNRQIGGGGGEGGGVVVVKWEWYETQGQAKPRMYLGGVMSRPRAGPSRQGQTKLSSPSEGVAAGVKQQNRRVQFLSLRPD